MRPQTEEEEIEVGKGEKQISSYNEHKCTKFKVQNGRTQKFS